ncbi:MAG: glycosyltransferase, partial [Verrucomicrobiota bacterium]
VLVASDHEPCSVARIEALASGVPAVATASGGNLDILQDGRTGLLFPPGDSAALARCLAALAEGAGPPATPAELRASVAHRSASAVATHYRELYGRLVANRGRPSGNPGE